MNRSSNFRFRKVMIGLVACVVLATSYSEASAQYYYAPTTAF